MHIIDNTGLEIRKAMLADVGFEVLIAVGMKVPYYRAIP
jgi:hypothetical protein